MHDWPHHRSFLIVQRKGDVILSTCGGSGTMFAVWVWRKGKEGETWYTAGNGKITDMIEVWKRYAPDEA